MSRGFAQEYEIRKKNRAKNEGKREKNTCVQAHEKRRKQKIDINVGECQSTGIYTVVITLLLTALWSITD